jgi:hypothetical protein
MKVYVAHPISTTGEFTDSLRVADQIAGLGFDIYAAAANASINDKTNEPTPVDIYEADVNELLTSNLVVLNLTGGQADGTITELGIVAGYNESIRRHSIAVPTIPVLGYTSNARLQRPQFWLGVPSASANHLSLGAIEMWGSFLGGETEMLEELGRIITKEQAQG